MFNFPRPTVPFGQPKQTYCRCSIKRRLKKKIRKNTIKKWPLFSLSTPPVVHSSSCPLLQLSTSLTVHSSRCPLLPLSTPLAAHSSRCRIITKLLFYYSSRPQIKTLSTPPVVHSSRCPPSRCPLANLEQEKTTLLSEDDPLK